jgi:hypothetical protein
LVVFESEYALPSAFVVKFIDKDKILTFKKPLFFKEHPSSVSNKMLYRAVETYFKNILKIYLQGDPVIKKIEDIMFQNI